MSSSCVSAGGPVRPVVAKSLACELSGPKASPSRVPGAILPLFKEVRSGTASRNHTSAGAKVSRMLAKHGFRAALGTVSIVALFGLATCSSSSAADGDSCSADKDCKSGRCGSAGTCEGSDCTCDGADCRSQSSCRSGWLCTRTNATTFDAIPQCRQECGGTFGTCPSNKHCDNGICLNGAEAFSLS